MLVSEQVHKLCEQAALVNCALCDQDLVDEDEAELRKTVLNFAVEMAEGFELRRDADDAAANGDGYGEDTMDDMDVRASTRKSCTARSRRIGLLGRESNSLEKERLRNFVAMQAATQAIEAGCGAWARRTATWATRRRRRAASCRSRPRRR